MCGILLNIGNEEITPNHPALEIIVHRGPDGFGAKSFDCENFRIGLGHRRLSIIDLSDCGSQPMSLNNGRFWIVFNGEIYNYREIRKELENDNFVFKSSSDTEVLLASYRKWGKNCLDKLNGMFAFIIYDSVEKRIFAARDRFGIKPLYYFNSASCFRVASEMKQFISIKGFTPELRPLKLYHFLNSGDFDFDDEPMWKDIFELEPGHFFELDLKKWKPGDKIFVQKWYEPPFFTEKLKISFEDAVCEFRRLLEDSVRLRMRSDVPVGFLLSGGLDSSTLVGLAHRMHERTENLKTYSSCYENTAIDEREYINEMIRFCNAESCLHFPQPEDVSDNLAKVIWHNDLPILHGSPTVHWLLYKKIKSENDARKVIIEGQGGDEIMCGYGDFHWAYLNECLHSCLFNFFSQLPKFQRVHKEKWKIIIRKFLRINFSSFVKYPPSELLNWKVLLDDRTDLSDLKISFPKIAIRREEPNVSLLQRNRFKILRYILHNVDRNSMAHSREARVPFLDYRLVEFCIKLPSGLKISDGQTKRVLRSASENVLPAKIAKRVDKQGYSSPVALWAKNSLKEFLKSKISEFSNLPFVNEKKCIESFEGYIAGKNHFDPVLWRIVCGGIWQEQFRGKF